MALSNIFSSTALSKMAQRLGLEPTHKDRPAWSYGTRYGKQGAVDARLTGILSAAAERFAREHPGYTVEATSGKKGRSSGTPWHPGGIATDVQITDPTGKKLGNYQDAKSFRTYEQFAQTAKAVQHETYPDLDSHFAWGGYYGGRFAADQMHFDLGPTRGSLGTWEGGLNKAGRNFLPGAESIGIGAQPEFADVPTPTERPDPRDPANMDPDPAFGNLGPMFGSRQRPNFAAPVGKVERARLAEALKASPISAVDAAPPQTASLAPDRQMPTGAVRPSLAPRGAFASLQPDRQLPSGPITGTPYKAGQVSMPAKTPTHFAEAAMTAPVTALGLKAADALGLMPDNLSSLPPDRPMPAGPVAAAATAQPTPADVAPASPVRPDNLQAAGPKGMFNVAPNLMSPEAMAPAPALSPPTEVKDNVIAPMTQTPAPAPIEQPAAVRQRVAAPAAQPAAPARSVQQQSTPSFDKDIAGVSPSEAFGVGSIADALGGPRGAFAMSRSAPGTGVINRGPMGTATFNSMGAVTPVGPAGDIRANRDTMKAWGRVLGGIFDSEKDKDKASRSGGGFSSSSSAGRGRGAFGAAGGRLGQSQHSL